MTQLPGLQISGGFQFISPHTEFRNSAGMTAENDVPAGIGLPPPGQFFITANLGDFGISSLRHVVVGVGLENLYGFAAKFPRGGPLQTSNIKAQLPLLDIKPTLAYKFSEWLSVGLGADIFTFANFIGEGHAERRFIGVGQVPGTVAGDELELNGKGTTAGINVSFLLTPLRHVGGQPLFNVGFIWRSQAVLPLEGSLLVNGAKLADASTSIRFPESYEWGFAVWPIYDAMTSWKIELDLEWIRWSSIRQADTSLSTGLVIPDPLKLDDTVNVMLGTQYTWNSLPQLPPWSLALRAGYHYAGWAGVEKAEYFEVAEVAKATPKVKF